jgi:hypothetical protein
MARRDVLTLLGLAALATAVAAVQHLTGLGADVLIAAPGLLLLLPLIAGRYVGEDGLVRIARAAAPPLRGAGPARVPLRGRRAVVPSGGLLIALALGRRGPPPVLAAR